jgi:hypothetical protein
MIPKKTPALVFALVLMLGAVAAAPALAADEMAPTGVAAPDDAPLFTPEPIEQAPGPKCGPHESPFGTTWTLFLGGPAECEAACTSYCQDGDGYLLLWTSQPRSLICSCQCCRVH